MQVISNIGGESIPLISGYTAPSIKIDQEAPTEVDGIQVGQMGQVVNKFKEFGINVRVTSGLRENAVTSNGNKSKHASGEAIDIVPGAGESFESMAQKVRSNPELVSWMQANGYGILRETSNNALKKTGGSGFHWHVGTDKSAVRDLSRMLEDKQPVLGRYGLKIIH